MCEAAKVNIKEMPWYNINTFISVMKSIFSALKKLIIDL
jgi:hypothetical protein